MCAHAPRRPSQNVRLPLRPQLVGVLHTAPIRLGHRDRHRLARHRRTQRVIQIVVRESLQARRVRRRLVVQRALVDDLARSGRSRRCAAWYARRTGAQSLRSGPAARSSVTPSSSSGTRSPQQASHSPADLAPTRSRSSHTTPLAVHCPLQLLDVAAVIVLLLIRTTRGSPTPASQTSRDTRSASAPLRSRSTPLNSGAIEPGGSAPRLACARHKHCDEKTHCDPLHTHLDLPAPRLTGLHPHPTQAPEGRARFHWR